MKKLLLIIISILLVSASIFCIIYFNKPIYTNKYFEIKRSDNIIIYNPSTKYYNNDGYECYGYNKAKFTKKEKEITYDFFKSLEFVKEFSERQEDCSDTIPIKIKVSSKKGKMGYRINSKDIIYCTIVDENQEIKWYQFKVPEEKLNSIMNLMND